MTDTMRSDTPTTGAGWGWIIAYGVLSMLFGLAALLWPFPATLAATLVIGVAFVSSGVFALIAGFRGTGAESRGYSILLGVLSIIAGVVMVARPLTGAISLTIVVAAWLLVRGVAEIALGFRMRRRRWLMVALGVVNILLALFIIGTVPFSALTLPGFILGVSFLFGGVTAIMAGIDHRAGASAFTFPG
ncbi:HdeD family acid-resistance protein [Sphingomonas jeddahensis]|uniref:Acid-resistance membrane protein n=1 Tax=Sphingomonas jeddahensis TaxID=1915074 RepID=A0A1V2ESJ1_9SPHN|nr:DUF308 domain-containing protein [Sphingomonas jeddahensis]ONF95139.1 acid-resistance membrane protein [Sphingomonas jeddahensis]